MGAKLQFRTKELSRNRSFGCNCVPNPEIGNENFGRLEIRLGVERRRRVTLIKGCWIMKLARNISYIMLFSTIT